MERLLAINSLSQDTGISYIRRATCSVQGIPIVTTSGVFGEDLRGEVLDAFEKACCRRFLGPDNGKPYPEARREKLLQMTMRKQLPVFFLVPEQAVKQEVIAALCQRFPAATLVLLAGASFPDGAVLDLSRLELVYPELQEDEEDQALSTIFLLRGLAGLHEATMER